MADAIPAGVPPEAAAAARDTLGGALAAAWQLPDQLGAALLDAAREAFTQGLHVTAGISAAVAIGSAIMAAVLLRHVGAGSEPEGQPQGTVSDMAAPPLSNSLPSLHRESGHPPHSNAQPRQTP